MAHGREAFRVYVALLWQALHQIRRIATAPTHAHWREKVPMQRMQQEVHALRPSIQAPEDASEEQDNGK
nr:unnamed protein product [Callosobruchus chinensis]